MFATIHLKDSTHLYKHLVWLNLKKNKLKVYSFVVILIYGHRCDENFIILCQHSRRSTNERFTLKS